MHILASLCVVTTTYGEHDRAVYESLATKYLDAWKLSNWTSLVETYHPAALDFMKVQITSYLTETNSESMLDRYGYLSEKEYYAADSKEIVLKDLNWGHQAQSDNELYKDMHVVTSRLTNAVYITGFSPTQTVLSTLCRSLSDTEASPYVINFYFKSLDGVPLIERATGGLYVEADWINSDGSTTTNMIRDPQIDASRAPHVPSEGTRRGTAPMMLVVRLTRNEEKPHNCSSHPDGTISFAGSKLHRMGSTRAKRYPRTRQITDRTGVLRCPNVQRSRRTIPSQLLHSRQQRSVEMELS
jgi:hypothetical protein